MEASIKGGNIKLKEIADKKIKAAGLQNAINETAEEYGLVADDLARGKVKVNKEALQEYAEYGKTIKKAQEGDKVIKGRGDKWSYTKAGDTGNPIWDDPKRYEQEWTPSVKTALSDKERAKKMLDYINNSYGNESNKVKKGLNKFSTDEEKINFLITQGTNKEVGPIHHVIDAAIKYTTPGITTALKEEPELVKEETPETQPIPYKRNVLMDIYNQALPYIRRMPDEQLDPRQLYGEMYGLASNELEPVDAQFYRPQLDVPYDISLQDQRNEVTAQTRAAQRMMGYNPAAQAMIAAQAYEPLNKITGEEFRLNQAMKDRVYSGNRATLNDAQLKNLAIADTQYQRQAQAKSNTKAIAQAALQSIGDKYVQNALENRKERIQSNLYPQFSFDREGRAINTGQLTQFNIPTVGSKQGTQQQVPVKDASGKVLYYQLEEYDPSTDGGVGTPPIKPAKNGKSIKAKNSSIVKSYKNL